MDLSLEDESCDVEMLLLQRIDLVKLKGVRKLLTVLQHEACAIESLVCIRTEWGDEGARLLGKAMLGKRTCEEGSATPIPGVTRGWEHMTHEDKVHGGRTDLGLKTLVMQQCGISEKGATSVAEALIGNHTISLLDLSGNRVGKEGIQALSFGLGHSLSLQHLGVHGNAIGAAETEVLETAVFDRWQMIQGMEQARAQRAAIRQSIQDAALAAAHAEAEATGETNPEKNLEVAPPPDSADLLPIQRKAFKLVTGSIVKPVVIRMIPPPADDHHHLEPIEGLTKMKDLPRWAPFDKRWLGIMEWQVKQKGWEEGRRGWCLVKPEKKLQMFEEKEKEQRDEEKRLADLERKKQLLEEQSWVEHAQAEGYQFLSFGKQPEAGLHASQRLSSLWGSQTPSQLSPMSMHAQRLQSPTGIRRPESLGAHAKRAESTSGFRSTSSQGSQGRSRPTSPLASPMGVRPTSQGRSRPASPLVSPMGSRPTSPERPRPESPMASPMGLRPTSHGSRGRTEKSPAASPSGSRSRSPASLKGAPDSPLASPVGLTVSESSPTRQASSSRTRPESSMTLDAPLAPAESPEGFHPSAQGQPQSPVEFRAKSRGRRHSPRTLEVHTKGPQSSFAAPAPLGVENQRPESPMYPAASESPSNATDHVQRSESSLSNPPSLNVGRPGSSGGIAKGGGGETAESVTESLSVPDVMLSSGVRTVPSETTRETISTEMTRDTLLSVKDTTLGTQSESLEFWMPEGSQSFDATMGMKP